MGGGLLTLKESLKIWGKKGKERDDEGWGSFFTRHIEYTNMEETSKSDKNGGHGRKNPRIHGVFPLI